MSDTGESGSEGEAGGEQTGRTDTTTGGTENREEGTPSTGS